MSWSFGEILLYLWSVVCIIYTHSCCTGQHLWRPGKQVHMKEKGCVSGVLDYETGDFTL